MDLGLHGRVVLVTGGAGRIGPVICATFVREGAAVGVVDVEQDRAEATAASLRGAGGQAVAVSADVSVKTDVERALERLTAAFGPVDVLVNAHGIAPNRLLLEADVDEWDRTFAVNTRGTMLTCQAVGNQMKTRGARGSMVNVSSGAATSARLGAAGYCGSKAAIDVLTQSLAIELGPSGIRVNAVSPGLVTDMPLRTGDAGISAYMQLMLDMTPLRRTGEPADIAEVVVFVASDCAAWMTGSIVPVSGGSHTGRPHVPLPRPPA